MLARNLARLLGVGNKWKTLIVIASFSCLAGQAFADPQSEISAYRKTYNLPAVTLDPKLTELARQQANAMAERSSMDHNVYASFRSRMASYNLHRLPKISQWARARSETLSQDGNRRLVIMRIC